MASTEPSLTARPRTRRAALVILIGSLSVALAACSTQPGNGPSGGAGVIQVVAAENFWGSIAAQLGGAKVQVRSIISSPDADPHSYEPTAADGRLIATADMVIVNGIGYDTWATKMVNANASPTSVTLTVGSVVGAADGDNPHRWYNPGDVQKVVDQIVADYTKINPADAAFFASQKASFETSATAEYKALIAKIRTRYAGTKVGASESIFAMLAPALGLDLITPPGFLKAISEGTDPTAADKITIDTQIRTRQIRVYVYNSQNATPDVQAQIALARAQGIPVTTITETLVPSTASWQAWQTAQLVALKAALAQATAR
jgi:zinc/manganese transport system substrate-binding protein